MKSIRTYLIIFLFFFSNNLFSQAHLTITDLTNFPISGLDTVYFNSPYNNIQVTITNTGNIGFQGEADVLIRGPLGVTDTLYADSLSGTILAPGDSVVRFPNAYLFSFVNYVDGDNIVVVWPQARIGNVTYDNIFFHIYYVSFQAIHELETKPLIISPNPGTDYIRLGVSEIKQFEYVRILNVHGQLVYESSESVPTINVKDWTSGLYYIEVVGINSRHSGRLIIQ